MLIKSRGVLFLLVQRFEALPTGIRSDTIRTASVLNAFKTLSLRPESLSGKDSLLYFRQ